VCVALCGVRPKKLQKSMKTLKIYYLIQFVMEEKKRQDVLILLKPRGFFTYHQVQYSKILHGACFALNVLYGSQKRQRLLLYTSLTDWFLTAVVESVYSAVRTDSLYKAVYVSSFKG
jgi:hypothetical protein